MAASCEETSDGSGFQRAQKRGSDRIQLVRRSGFSELLKKLPTACQTDRWATGDPVSSEKSSRLLTVCGTIMVQWALKELPIAHRLLGDRRFNEFWKSYRSLTVGGMIGGSVCSKRSPWLHTDCMQIAYRLHTAKNVWKSYIWIADKNLNEIDPRSNEHYLSSSENKAWKKFRPVRDLNPWPLRYRCSALPTELKSQLGAGHYEKRPYFHYCSSSAHYCEDHFHSDCIQIAERSEIQWALKGASDL